MFSLNSKYVHHVKIYIPFKIYMPCNFEVNLITHLGVIALFSYFFFYLNIFVRYFKIIRDKG